jgi:hypothetical protein
VRPELERPQKAKENPKQSARTKPALSVVVIDG